MAVFFASRRKQSMITCESLATGKTQLSGYVFNATPLDSNQSKVSLALNCSKACLRNFSPLGYFSANIRLLKVALQTLHLPPPEIFTFAKNFVDFSKIVTSASG